MQKLRMVCCHIIAGVSVTTTTALGMLLESGSFFCEPAMSHRQSIEASCMVNLGQFFYNCDWLQLGAHFSGCSELQRHRQPHCLQARLRMDSVLLFLLFLRYHQITGNICSLFPGVVVLSTTIGSEIGFRQLLEFRI